MNKIIPIIQECISNIKANLTMSAITIMSSLLIAKIFVFPYIKGKKKNLDYSRMKLNYFINLLKKSEIIKPINIIFMPVMNKILRALREDEDYDENDYGNDNVVKIKKTKKIIKKLTKEFMKQEEKDRNNNQSQTPKDKIFYILLNNMHFINNNCNNNQNNNNHNHFNENLANTNKKKLENF